MNIPFIKKTPAHYLLLSALLFASLLTGNAYAAAEMRSEATPGGFRDEIPAVVVAAPVGNRMAAGRSGQPWEEPDSRVLRASAADDVDRAAGRIRVTGVGVPPQDAPNSTVRREMAERAALADAERKLVKAVAEIKIGPDQNAGSRMNKKNFSRKIQGYIKGYTVVGERELADGTVEIDLELPLNGQNGLSR
ncbi:MAG: hypothetical protein A2010_17525 [Nitrospirae bacterium GWD2_57_9]|nr:MAG: hypothetical protein A2010_17525 [Nitrospirae bacterium GWD2_57_9]